MKKIRVLLQIVAYGFILFLLMRALSISSFKVRVVFGGLTVAAFAISRWKTQWMKYIIVGLCMVFLLLSGIYNVRNLGAVLPMTKNEVQTLYAPENLQEGTYPDSFLRLLVRGKKVTVPYEIKDYGMYSKNRNSEDGEKFPARYFKESNYARFFKAYAKETLVDSTLSENAIAEYQEDFTWIGYGSDMLRYTFLLNTDGVQQSTYFWYSWYYYSFYGEASGHDIVIYVNLEDIAESDDLVAIWTKEEDLYLMTRDYYEREIAHGHL